MHNLEVMSANGNFCFPSARIGITASTGDYQNKAFRVNNAFDVLIKGVYYPKAALDPVYDTCAIQAAGTTCLYSITTNKNGGESSYNVLKGTHQLTGSGQPLLLADLSEDIALIGIVKIVTTSAFTFGVTDFTAAGVVDTYRSRAYPPTENEVA